MSEDADRNKVLQTTRVRTALKNDVSWIQKSKQDKKEKDQARTDQAVETRPVPVRQNSYVLLTAKKFEDSANQANGEVIPLRKDAQPEGSTVETTDDTKPQAPTEELIKIGKAQPGKSVANTTAENKEEHADTAVYQSNVKHNEGAAEVSVDVHVEERIQNGEGQPASSTTENPEAVSPVEPAEQRVANKAAYNKGEYADTTVDQSNVEQNEAKVSADAHVAETSAAAGTEESKDTPAEVPAVPAVELKPQEEPSNETEPANTTHLEDAGVKSAIQHAEGSCEICPPEQATEEIVEAAAEVAVESSPDKSVVINATPGEEAAHQDSVAPIPQSLAESVSESPTQPAAETATEGSCEKGPAEQAAGETVAAAAEVAVESSTEIPAVTNAAGEGAALQDSVGPVPDSVADTLSESPTQPAAETATEGSCEKCPAEQAAGETVAATAEVAVEPSTETSSVTHAAEEEAAHQDTVEPVPDSVPVADTVSKSPTQPAAETATEESCEKGPAEQAAGETVAAAAEVAVESSTDTLSVTNAAGEEAALQDSVGPVSDSGADTVSESPTQPAAETATEESCEKGPAEQAAGETVAAVAEVAVESSPEIPTVTHAAGEKAALQDTVEPVPDSVPVADTVSESPTQPAAETAIKSAECEVASAASAEPVLKSRAEDVVECEVQSNEQSVEPTPGSAAEPAVELSIKDAVDPVTGAEAVQDKFAYRAIELTDALDVEPSAEGAPEPLKDPKQSQSHTEETKMNQQSDDTNTPETFQKPAEELQSTQTLKETRDIKAICSFCDRIIDGTVKITLSEPLVICHPECLKCGGCDKALGDFLSPMFLHDQVIHCDGCFAETLKT